VGDLTGLPRRGLQGRNSSGESNRNSSRAGGYSQDLQQAEHQLSRSSSALKNLARTSAWILHCVGTPVQHHNLHNRSWKPLLKQAGLHFDEVPRPPRHTCATLLLTKGGSTPRWSRSFLYSSIITLDTMPRPLPGYAGGGCDGQSFDLLKNTVA